MQLPMECREPPHRSKTHFVVAFLERLKDILENVSEYNSHYRFEKDKFDTFLYLLASCYLNITYSAKN